MMSNWLFMFILSFSFMTSLLLYDRKIEWVDLRNLAIINAILVTIIKYFVGA